MDTNTNVEKTYNDFEVGELISGFYNGELRLFKINQISFHDGTERINCWDYLRDNHRCFRVQNLFNCRLVADEGDGDYVITKDEENPRWLYKVEFPDSDVSFYITHDNNIINRDEEVKAAPFGEYGDENDEDCYEFSQLEDFTHFKFPAGECDDTFIKLSHGFRSQGDAINCNMEMFVYVLGETPVRIMSSPLGLED